MQQATVHVCVYSESCPSGRSLKADSSAYGHLLKTPFFSTPIQTVSSYGHFLRIPRMSAHESLGRIESSYF